MPINLSKGQKVDLTKKNPGLKNIMVGLGWDVNAFDSCLVQMGNVRRKKNLSFTGILSTRPGQ